MILSIKNGGYVFFYKVRFNVFYVIMKNVPIVTNFKRLIYQTFNQINLVWKRCKALKFNRNPVKVSSIGTFNYDLARFNCDLFSTEVPNDYSWKDTFSFAPQIKNANPSGKFLVSYDATSFFNNIPHQEATDIAIDLIFNYNTNLNITKKILKNFSFLLHHTLILILTVNFIIKLME